MIQVTQKNLLKKKIIFYLTHATINQKSTVYMKTSCKINFLAIKHKFYDDKNDVYIGSISRILKHNAAYPQQYTDLRQSEGSNNHMPSTGDQFFHMLLHFIAAYRTVDCLGRRHYGKERC